MSATIYLPEDRSLGILYTRFAVEESWTEGFMAQGEITIHASSIKLDVGAPNCKVFDRQNIVKDLVGFMRQIENSSQSLTLEELRFVEWHGALTDEAIDTMTSVGGLSTLIIYRSILSKANFFKLLRLPGLKKLEFVNSKFTNYNAKIISASSDVESLNLSGTNVPKDCLTLLSESRQLRHLDISYTKLDAHDIETISKFPRLSSLSVAGAKVDSSAIDYLKRLSSLESLDLAATNVNEDFVQRLLSEVPLVHLSIANTKIGDLVGSKSAISNGLKTFDLSSTAVTDNIVSFINTTQISKLALPGTEITDQAIKSLREDLPLVEINLSDTKITTLSIERLARIRSITSLSLQDANISHGTWEALAKCVNLKSLQIDGTHLLDPPHLATEMLQNLERFSAYGLPITSFSWLRYAKNLRYLVLGETQFTDQFCAFLSDKRIETLVLSDTKVTDKGLESIGHMKYLRYLKLDGCSITSNSYESIIRLNYLRFLDIVGCNVSLDMVNDLDSALPYCCIVA